MATQDVESGFEALLKPLQDVTSKMWDIMLTEALEKYLEQINNGDTSVVNFTEAAVLVQNSASFYCKRVDSVHLGCRQFVEKLINTYNNVFGSNRIMDVIHENLNLHKDKEESEEDGQQVRKRRTPKSFINDSFEPLDLFFTDGNIDVNLETLDKFAEKKKVILNKYIKAGKKPNTSCPVYQSKGSEMGLKEEYRLHWGISSNGVLNEDFVTTKVPRTLDWCVLSGDVGYDDPEPEVLRNSFTQLANDFQMDVDEPPGLAASPECSALAPSPIPPTSPLAPLPSISSEKVQIEKQPVDYCKELKFNFKIPSHALIKKQVFSIPKRYIDECNDWKARKLESKVHSNDTCSSNFFDFLKHKFLLNKSSGDDERLFKHAKRRSKEIEIQMRQQQYAKAIAGASKDINDDFLGFDGDDNADNDNFDIQLDNVGDLVVVDVPPFDKDTQDRDDREEMMAAFKENKRRFAAELTEVARRVQSWHESLASVLEAAEARSQYDVHNYGTRILDVFKEPPEKVPVIPFYSVVQDQPGVSKPEISRYLLSTLMLANTYNVEIMQDQGDLVKDCLKLKLLSTVRHHEEMDENLKSNTHC